MIGGGLRPNAEKRLKLYIHPALAKTILISGGLPIWSGMRDDTTLTEEDEGKTVVNTTGDEVGRVMEVEHGKAHVEPDPGLTDSIKSKLGWGDHDEDTYQLDADSVETISDDEIRLNR